MAKRVFLVSSGRLAVYHWHAGQFDEPLIFAADEEGLGSFSTYLDRDLDDPVYILVDFVEEEFREDTVPHVLGPDRRALIKTKLNRLFRDATYSHAIFQGREEEGRRDDRMLFAALIRPDLLAPWIGQISAHKVPLAGVYSLPVLTEQLLKHVPVESSHALVVTLQSAGALRQTFFLHQQLKLSRLAVMPQLERHGYASYVLGEVEKIRRYLNSLRLLPHDNPVDVYIVADPSLLDDIRRQSPDSLTTRHHLSPLADVAGRLGLKDEYRSSYADRLFAHLLARKSPPNQYAPSSHMRYYAMHRARFGMKVASALLFLVSALWGGVKFVDGVVAVRDTESAQQQVAFYEDRYAQARERLPPTPADSRDMQLAVEMAGKIRDYKTSPLLMLIKLSDGLEGFPAMQLVGVDWTASTNPERAFGGQERAQGLLDSLLGGDDPPQPGTVLYQIADVSGRIDPFSGDYREALDMVSAFAEALRNLPDVLDVQVLSLPLDIGSETSLTGDAGAEASGREAPFELRVVLKDRENEAG